MTRVTCVIIQGTKKQLSIQQNWLTVVQKDGSRLNST